MKKILGYSNTWGIAPGETLNVMVSTYGPTRYHADLIRVICGDDHPDHGLYREEEIEAVSKALAAGDTEKAMRAVTVEMQDQVAVVGTAEECRAALEKRRDAGLQLPVIAPFAVGDNMTSHQHVIDALAPRAKSP